MKVLMHYTTQRVVFDVYSKNGIFDNSKVDLVNQISDFYNKYKRTQHHLFFIVSYYNQENCETKYCASNINYNENDNKYNYVSVSDDMCKMICSELGLTGSNAYASDVYYRVFTIEDNEKTFTNNNRENDLNKIKLKFFTWDELVTDMDILFMEVCDKIFNVENVLKIASTYKPSIKYSEQQKIQKYSDSLKALGFISENGVNVSHTMLHGDIGEFLMHIMLNKFLSEHSTEKYIFPKLVFKTSPNMPVYGNDGTMYLKDKKEIYYLEAKFYSDLNSALNKAVNSLSEHNETTRESYSHKIELFRNIETDQLDEIIEIDKDVSENLAMFLMCDDHTNYDEMLDIIRSNRNLKNLKSNFNIVIFVLPILSKEEYLKYFKIRSSAVWEELNAL